MAQALDLAQHGAPAEAVELLRQALELKPRDAETWNSLGVVLARQREAGPAADAFTQALRLKPDHAEAHKNLAVLLDRQGKSEAAAHYRAFLRLTGENDPARDDVRRRLTEVSGVSASGPR